MQLERLVVTGVSNLMAQDQAEGAPQEELPDDYLPLTFVRIDDRLEGGSEFLEGFSFTMKAPRSLLGSELSTDMLFTLVRGRYLSGVVTHPNGKTSALEFEIVHHRGIDEIYMKSSLGYFLWEYLVADANTLNFAIYWWYCPPATEKDLEIVKMAGEFLEDPSSWNNDDDRQCENDIETNQWSLFCALMNSTMEITGEYNHHGTAIQAARFVIDELVPDHGFAHTLMDYNNAPSTSHRDIIHVLDMARLRIEKELNTRQYGIESEVNSDRLDRVHND